MLKKSLTDSWSFFKTHAAALSIIILPIVVPIDVFTALYQNVLAIDEPKITEQLIPIIIGFVAYPIYEVGIVFYIASVISGERIDTKTSWRLGAKFWRPYVVMSIFVGLAVMLGLVLLVIPGIIFAVRYTFAGFDLLLNQSTPLDAMKHSWDASKDYMWVLLRGYMIITLVLYAPYYLIASLFDESGVFYLVLDTSSNIIYSVVGALYTIFAFRVYEFARLRHNQSLNQDAP